MKKMYLMLVFVLSVSLSFASSDLGNKIKSKKITKIEKECSLSSSGTVETPWGPQTMSLTVHGACDASLSRKLRAAIKGLRDSFK
jgi:hypothetical protein